MGNRGQAAFALLGASLLCACSASRTEDPTPDEQPPECVAGAGQLPVEGCNAGIPPDACGEGFEADGMMGCTAILPAESCPNGAMATPGDTGCREIAPCGSDTWGDIVTDSTSQFVDGSYTVGDSDGTDTKPWATVGEAITAADDGAVIAIASGSYAEDLRVDGKRVELWGRCPSMVELSGSDMALAALQLDAGASGSAVRNLAITGAAAAISVNGASDVIIEGVWIHDTGGSGVLLQPDLLSSATIDNSLLERVAEVGIHAVGADADVTGSQVRGTVEVGPYATGYAIVAQRSMAGQQAAVDVSGSLFEGNHSASLLFVGSMGTVTASVVRGTLPSALSSRDGVGVLVQDSNGAPSDVTVQTSVIGHNRARGIAVVGSNVVIENTHVHDTQPQAWDDSSGEGIAILSGGGIASTADIRTTTVANSYESGISVHGSSANIVATLVRDTEPRRRDDDFGRGIAVIGQPDEGLSADATMDSCMVDNSFAFGIYVTDATASIQSTLIRGTKAQVSDGRFGDGLTVASKDSAAPPTQVDVFGSRSQDNVGSGISLFAASMSVDSSSMECNAIDLLASEDSGSAMGPFVVTDNGDNVCGCKGLRRECSVSSP